MKTVNLVVLATITALGVVWFSSSLENTLQDSTPQPQAQSSKKPYVRVIDPDTLEVSTLDKHLRIINADGPEKGGRAKCDRERELERAGRVQSQALFDAAKEITVLLDDPPKTDRYDRYLGNIEFDGYDYREVRIMDGFLKPWNYGKEPKPEWCD